MPFVKDIIFHYNKKYVSYFANLQQQIELPNKKYKIF